MQFLFEICVFKTFWSCNKKEYNNKKTWPMAMDFSEVTINIIFLKMI